MGDEAKKTILLRRARFVAAAMAGLAVPACGKTTAAPDAGTTHETPAPCLTFAPPPPDPPDASFARPCLEVAPPKKDGGR
jgi:hypothetical protein